MLFQTSYLPPKQNAYSKHHTCHQNKMLMPNIVLLNKTKCSFQTSYLPPKQNAHAKHHSINTSHTLNILQRAVLPNFSLSTTQFQTPFSPTSSCARSVFPIHIILTSRSVIPMHFILSSRAPQIPASCFHCFYMTHHTTHFIANFHSHAPTISFFPMPFSPNYQSSCTRSVFQCILCLRHAQSSLCIILTFHAPQPPPLHCSYSYVTPHRTHFIANFHSPAPAISFFPMPF